MKNVALIIPLFLFNSCAVIFSGSTQEIKICSNAKDARIYSNFDHVGYTNKQFELKRSDIPKMYTIKKEGCRDTSFVLNERFNKLCYLDVLIPYFYAFDLAVETHRKTDDSIYIQMICDE